MKVFLVEANDFDYDEFDSCVVVAESEEDALKVVEEDGYVYFSEYQRPLRATEVSLKKRKVVDYSFNAG